MFFFSESRSSICMIVWVVSQLHLAIQIPQFTDGHGGPFHRLAEEIRFTKRHRTSSQTAQTLHFRRGYRLVITQNTNTPLYKVYTDAPFHRRTSELHFKKGTQMRISHSGVSCHLLFSTWKNVADTRLKSSSDLCFMACSNSSRKCHMEIGYFRGYFDNFSEYSDILLRTLISPLRNIGTGVIFPLCFHFIVVERICSTHERNEKCIRIVNRKSEEKISSVKSGHKWTQM
jgi:hypothetical protein